MAIEKTIAVLSGKGGTGKTLLSVNLARAAGNATYIDCDIEEPNGQLFLKPIIEAEEQVFVAVPMVEQGRCDGCRLCVKACAFNALALVGGQILVFEDVCHSCLLCMAVCPHQAITEQMRPIGTVKMGSSKTTHFLCGELRIGEPSAVQILKTIFTKKRTGVTIIDSPPGSGCLVSESIEHADFCLLVAEPTLFGRHNLAMVHELVKLMGKPCAVVLNKTQEGSNPSGEYANDHHLDILYSIPYDRDLATLSSQGKVAYDEDSRFKTMFDDLYAVLLREVE